MFGDNISIITYFLRKAISGYYNREHKQNNSVQVCRKREQCRKAEDEVEVEDEDEVVVIVVMVVIVVELKML
jgi:hypothetical protein